MHTININDRKLAIGLEWSFHDSQRELRAALRRDKVTAACIITTEEGVFTGVVNDERPGRSQHAAAILAGRLCPDSLIYHQLDEESVWVCAIREGLPLPGTDRVCPIADAEQQLAELAGYQTEAVLLGSHPAARQSLEQLLEEPEKTDWQYARLKPVQGRTTTWLTVSLIITTAVVAYQLYEAPTEVMPVLPSLVNSPIELVDIVPAKSAPDPALINAARESALLEWQMAQADIGTISEQWLTLLTQLPVSHIGYRPVRMNCRLDICIVDWQWNGNRFFAEAMLSLPGELLPTSLQNHARVQTRFTLEAANRQQPLALVEQREHFQLQLTEQLSLPGLRLHLPTQQQLLQLDYQVDGDSFQDEVATIHTVQLSAASLLAARVGLQKLNNQNLYPVSANFSLTGNSVSLQLETRYVVATL